MHVNTFRKPMPSESLRTADSKLKENAAFISKMAQIEERLRTGQPLGSDVKLGELGSRAITLVPKSEMLKACAICQRINQLLHEKSERIGELDDTTPIDEIPAFLTTCSIQFSDKLVPISNYLLTALQSESDFFGALDSDFQEGMDRRLRLEILSAEEFEIFISVLFHSDVNQINSENFYNLAKAANYLMIPKVEKSCANWFYEYLEERAKDEDEEPLRYALEHLVYAQENRFSFVKKECEKFIQKEIRSCFMLNQLHRYKEIIDKLKNCEPKIRSLSLNLSKLDNLENEHLAALQGLSVKRLNLSECEKLNDETLKVLEGLPLVEMNLSKCPISQDAILDLVRFPKLRKIDLSACPKLIELKEETVKALEGLPLSDINFSFSPITDETVMGLANFTKLRKLDLSNCANLTDQACEVLGKLLIHDLSLMSCEKITDKGFALLADHPSLMCLDLGNCLITREGIAQLPPLVSLNLSGCTSLVDASIPLIKHQKLTRLSLAGLMITDIGIESLFQFSNLDYIKLDYCRFITAQAIKTLAEFKKLRFVSLQNCPQFNHSSFEVLNEKGITIRTGSSRRKSKKSETDTQAF